MIAIGTILKLLPVIAGGVIILCGLIATPKRKKLSKKKIFWIRSLR